MLLENIEGCDVIFKVGDEKFHAHKLVLAARSPIFRSQFYQQERDHDDIIIIDMEPKVFEAMLHFIYRDELTDELVASSSSREQNVSDIVVAKLLAAVDRYDLTGLKRICESRLCKGLDLSAWMSSTNLGVQCLNIVSYMQKRRISMATHLEMKVMKMKAMKILVMEEVNQVKMLREMQTHKDLNTPKLKYYKICFILFKSVPLLIRVLSHNFL
ncbi:hypothetical protein Lser_V15G41396 [Lactuca serriola]